MNHNHHHHHHRHKAVALTGRSTGWERRLRRKKKSQRKKKSGWLGRKRTATQGEKATWGRSVRSGCGKAPTPYAHPMQVFVHGWLAGVFMGLALGIGSGAVRFLRQAGDVVLGVGYGARDFLQVVLDVLAVVVYQGGEVIQMGLGL